ncbi:hypothetical protein CTE05_07130 [Cellulomonas terrae]|uniref:Uncharacterized protein n=1 Tax=Cellulomonas terrae TaxID=311234 RepID=A0A511JGU7_9CELL|nr:hypothetical protein CTE05_07130 [Cellulomonas terrae]
MSGGGRKVVFASPAAVRVIVGGGDEASTQVGTHDALRKAAASCCKALRNEVQAP